MSDTLLLLPDCVLPGCRNAVTEHGDVCTECRNLFGDMLSETDRPALTADRIAARDRDTAAAYATHRQLTAGGPA